MTQTTQLKPKTQNDYITKDEPETRKSLGQEVRAHHKRLEGIDTKITEIEDSLENIDVDIDLSDYATFDYVNGVAEGLESEFETILDSYATIDYVNEGDLFLQGEIDNLLNLIGDAGNWTGDVAKAYVDGKDALLQNQINNLDFDMTELEEAVLNKADKTYVDEADANLQEQIDNIGGGTFLDGVNVDEVRWYDKVDHWNSSVEGYFGSIGYSSEAFPELISRHPKPGDTIDKTIVISGGDTLGAPDDFIMYEFEGSFLPELKYHEPTHEWALVTKKYVDDNAGGGGAFADGVNVGDVNWGDKVDDLIENVNGYQMELITEKTEGYVDYKFRTPDNSKYITFRYNGVDDDFFILTSNYTIKDKTSLTTKEYVDAKTSKTTLATNITTTGTHTLSETIDNFNEIALVVKSSAGIYGRKTLRYYTSDIGTGSNDQAESSINQSNSITWWLEFGINGATLDIATGTTFQIEKIYGIGRLSSTSVLTEQIEENTIIEKPVVEEPVTEEISIEEKKNLLLQKLLR